VSPLSPITGGGWRQIALPHAALRRCGALAGDHRELGPAGSSARTSGVGRSRGLWGEVATPADERKPPKWCHCHVTRPRLVLAAVGLRTGAASDGKGGDETTASRPYF